MEYYNYPASKINKKINKINVIACELNIFYKIISGYEINA